MEQEKPSGDAASVYAAIRPYLNSAFWNDYRNADTLAWLMTGVLQSRSSNVSKWIAHTPSKGIFKQSVERRYHRFLENDKFDGHEQYKAIAAPILRQWGDNEIIIALDTSMLWNKFCDIRITAIYRGRGVTLAWKLIEHDSASVDLSQLIGVLEDTKNLLDDAGITKVIFLADRGFADTSLMRYVANLKWEYIIRIKSSFTIRNLKKELLGKVGTVEFKEGQSKHYHNVLITKIYDKKVHIALARVPGASEPWYLVSSRPTSNETFRIYGFRFDIEEVFKDHKSAGFDIESSGIRDAKKLDMLMLVLSLAMLFLVSEGTEVVDSGNRRFIDPHWNRGLSYMRIGWQNIQNALLYGRAFFSKLRLIQGDDPDPCRKKKTWIDHIANLSSEVFQFPLLS